MVLKGNMMIAIFNVLIYVCLIIIAFAIYVKTSFMISLKKQNKWCPRNRWVYSSDYNDAISHSWYKTIELADAIRKNRLQLKQD